MSQARPERADAVRNRRAILAATEELLAAHRPQDISIGQVALAAGVGKGTVFPQAITPINGAPLTSNGKPEVLYIGAEFCPYCATERWPMTIALSRFGTFSPLHGIHSSSTDVPASIPTVTFYKSTYTSKYLTFTPVETTTTDRTQPLQVPTSAQTIQEGKYDPRMFLEGAPLQPPRLRRAASERNRDVWMYPQVGRRRARL